MRHPIVSLQNALDRSKQSRELFYLISDQSNWLEHSKQNKNREVEF